MLNNQASYYVIEHDIKPPSARSEIGKIVAQMKKGSSILAPNRSKASIFTQYMTRKNIKWTTRTEPLGVRVWRLSDNQLFEIDMNKPKSS